MVRNSSVVVVALAIGLTLDGAPLSAQTFEACRVPSVGVIYMINVGDAPAACLDPSHVQFTWTEGGAPPDGSITSATIADGTITPADMAAGIGVEFGSGFANLDPGIGGATAATLAVSYPATGYIVAHGTGQVQCAVTASITLGITNNATTTDGWIYTVPVAAAYTMVHKQDVLPVTGAGTATVNFNIGQTTDNCSYFRVINFDAVYVPVRY